MPTRTMADYLEKNRRGNMAVSTMNILVICITIVALAIINR